MCKICTNCNKVKEIFNFSKMDKHICRVCSLDQIFNVIEKLQSSSQENCVIVIYIKDKLLGNYEFNIYNSASVS